MEFNVNRVLENMAKKDYPYFVSERHFQVAFIIEAKNLYKNYYFYPEYVYKDKYHIDLLVCDEKDNERIALEFKYVVTSGKINISKNNSYQLKKQAAINIRRYQCIKDINRLETYVDSPDLKCKKGYFILLTNDHLFWEGTTKNSVDYDFDIKDKTTLKAGNHKYKGQNKKAKKQREVSIKHDYPIKYKRYCSNHKVDDCATNDNIFKTLIITVK